MPTNPNDDRNQISQEKHELDYVLVKWDKAASIGNREILSAELSKFKADPAWSPHNRERFYQYADAHGIKQLLADREKQSGPQTVDLESDDTDHPYTIIKGWGAPPPPKPEPFLETITPSPETIVMPPPSPPGEPPKKSRAVPVLIVLALIAVAALIFFLFFFKPQAQTKVAEPEATVTEETPETTGEALATQFAQTVKSNTPLYFIPDQEFWLPQETGKLETIRQAMTGLTKIDLTVYGHTADAGLPNPQWVLSKERAESVRDYLLKNAGETKLSILLIAKGATEPAIKDVPLNQQEKNRRVEITVNSAE